MSLPDIIQFIKKEHKAFSKWTDEEIGTLVVSYQKDHIFIVSQDNTDKIDGIILARIYVDKILHIKICIAKTKAVLRKFLDIYEHTFSNYTMEGERRLGLTFKYNTRKLVRLLYA